jgi:hypothetical protein
MTDRAAWDEALTAAENGRPARLAALIPTGVPDFALERLAAWIRIAKVPGPRARYLARAYEHFHQARKTMSDRAAFSDTLKHFDAVDAPVLNNVLAKNRQDVNSLVCAKESTKLVESV